MVPDAAVYCDRNRNDRYFVDSINLYYNTGVIVCDFDKWISAGITESIVNGLSSSNSDFYYPEQTALSFFCQDFIFRLPLKFNLYTPLQKISYKTYTKIFPKKIIFTKTEFAEASSSFYILHFYGRSVYKPWFRNNSCVYSSLYKKVEKSLFGKNIPNIKWPVAMSKKERIKSIIVLITSKLLPRDTYMRILSHIK
jgi:lipopolysaccharide biosynthesis glycosyltransferase